MSFRRYERYKDSGVEWLGHVPVEWNPIKVKNLFRIKKDIAGTEGHRVLSITQKGVIEKDIQSGDGQISMDYSKYQLVNRGDFAMNHMDLLTGFVDISPLEGVTSPDYRVFTLNGDGENVPRFFLYLFQNGYKARIFFAFGQGSSQLGRWRFPTEQFLNFILPVPPPSEQQAIASFLDRETAKIDGLIAEQVNLIALLKEKRQAVIWQVVTKGLNADVPMKDSGVEWLGEVPEGWITSSIWLMFELGRGRVISHEDIAKNPGEYPVYSSQTESNGEMGRIGTYDFDGEYITWTTDGANAGTVFLREGKFNCTNVCGTLRSKGEDLSLMYFVYSLNVATAFFVRHDINPKLMNNVMAKIKVPIPPPPEQKAIVAYIDNETSKHDELTAEAQLAIELLKERRSALVSAAVTGKINVINHPPSPYEPNLGS